MDDLDTMTPEDVDRLLAECESPDPEIAIVALGRFFALVGLLPPESEVQIP